MKKNDSNQYIGSHLTNLSLQDLRQQWAQVWGLQPHSRIGRTTLLKSLEFKIWEQKTGGLTQEQKKRLKRLLTSYKRNPRCFDENVIGIKPGTRIIKIWKEKRHSVLVVENGFEYEGKFYENLSRVAMAITGTKWSGWKFFGLKKGDKDK